MIGTSYNNGDIWLASSKVIYLCWWGLIKSYVPNEDVLICWYLVYVECEGQK